MVSNMRFRALCMLATGWLAISLSGFASGQAGDGSVFKNFSLNGLGQKREKPTTWTASYQLADDGQSGTLEVECDLSPSWHISSTTQKPGGPLPTEITISGPKGVVLAGPLKPDHAPKKSISDIYNGLELEEFHDLVVWTAPIKVPAGFQGQIQVAIDTATCSDAGKCMPVREKLVAKRSPAPASTVAMAPTPQNAPPAVVPAAAKPKPFRDGKYVVEWLVVGPTPIAPGKKGAIQFTATPDAKFHVYAAAVDDSPLSTNFAITQKSGLKAGTPTTKNPIVFDNSVPALPQKYHNGKVTWQLPLTVPAGTAPGKYPVEGFVIYQACTKTSCHPPTAMKFKTDVVVGNGDDASPVVLASAKRSVALDAAATKWVDGDEAKAAPKPDDQSSIPPSDSPTEPSATQSLTPPVNATIPAVASAADSAVEDSPEAIAAMAKLYDPSEKIKYLTLEDMESNPIGSGGVSSGNQTTFWSAMIGAFFGGMLLNLMPCVFPVLGLKVMGFVKQAGSDPGKIRLHGIAFALGLLVAMWILAGIILLFKISFGQDINWGAQMGNPYFVCSMIVLLFLLGLNMVGVFEFGTSISGATGQLQVKEGYGSSFMSGALTTLIATPCSGPFLGTAMSYTLAQTAGIAMLLFTIFALGIAVPYLVLCFFPSLISKLPKPGAWMETFKVTMAFALFATVAFFMNVFGNQTSASALSFLAMALVVIGLAAYYYGNWTRPHVTAQKKLWCGYVLPAAIACLGGWMCFSAAGERSEGGSSLHAGGLAWQDWNPGKVQYTLAKNKRPVWVEYTAHWCPTCKLNEKRVFSDDRVVEKLKELGVDLIVVDDTLREERIARDLKRADRSIIPVNLIYPPNYPEEPAILLEELVSADDALKVLKRMEMIQQSVGSSFNLSMAR